MELDINPDPQDLNGKNKNKGRKPWQYACIIIAVGIAVGFSLFTDMNTNVNSMICAVLAVPFGYVGFFNKNGLDFFEYRKKKKENSSGSSAFLYATEKYAACTEQTQKNKGKSRNALSMINKLFGKGGGNIG